jgi:hypothetical protein
MVTVDITADLNDEDETGFVWTFLNEARDPSLIAPGAIVVAGDADAPAVAEVVDVVDKPAGKIVHLRLLPGVIEDYEALVRRALTTAYMDEQAEDEARRRAAALDLRALLEKFRRQDAASGEAIDEETAMRIANEELDAYRRGRS